MSDLSGISRDQKATIARLRRLLERAYDALDFPFSSSVVQAIGAELGDTVYIRWAAANPDKVIKQKEGG